MPITHAVSFNGYDLTDIIEAEMPVDASEHVAGGDMILKAEIVK